MDNNDRDDGPLSESNVSLKLALIQQRCSELLDASDDFGGLTLADEDPKTAPDGTNPYDRG